MEVLPLLFCCTPGKGSPHWIAGVRWCIGKNGHKKSPKFFQLQGFYFRRWRASDDTFELFPPIRNPVDFIDFYHLPLFKDSSFLHDRYVIQGLSIAQISAEIGSSKEAVRLGLAKAGISVREPHLPHLGRESQPAYGKRRLRGKAAEAPVEQRVIKAIHDLKAQGLGLRGIAKALSQLGVSTKSKGKRWHPQMVKRILDRAYLPFPRIQE